jgi:NADH-quinone oxidoreductase subunit F
VRRTDRLLPTEPVRSLDDHLAAGGGAGLERALELDTDAIVDELDRAGLRGRGGAGFPTASKWRGVRRPRPPPVAA